MCKRKDSTVILEWSIINPLPLMSDQERISPYNINTMSSREVMGINKNIISGELLVDLMPNYLNQHHENCMADSKEYY